MKHFTIIAKAALQGVLMVFTLMAYAQVGINEPNPDASSVLELKSIDRGFLPPRLTTLQAGEINAPSEGLMYFNTSYSMPFFLDRSQSTPKWQGLSPFLFYIDSDETSTIAADLFLHEQVTNVAIGTVTQTPQSKLHIFGNLTIGNNTTAAPTEGLYVEGQAKIDGGLDIAGEVGRRNTAVSQSSNGYYQTTFYGKGTVPIGGIIMWSGSTSNIPEGWTLHTPLANSFIVAAGSSYTAGTGGGVDQQTLTEAQMPSHNHGSGSLGGKAESAGSHSHSVNYYGANGVSYAGSGSNDNIIMYKGESINGSVNTGSGGSHTHILDVTGDTGSEGSGATFDNRPKYYALAFIRRVQ